MIKEFLSKNKLPELDDKRQISDEEKIAVFAKKRKCELCGIPFKDHKAAEYHHKDRYTDGGKSIVDNIMILCTTCHDRVHGVVKIEIPNEEDFEEEEI